jgi:hypothetical protein
MKMTVRGREVAGALLTFGTIERHADGKLEARPTEGGAVMLADVLRMDLQVRLGLLIKPGDPRWFYALPLGLRGVVTWAEPDDVEAWKKVAEPMFDLKPAKAAPPP